MPAYSDEEAIRSVGREIAMGCSCRGDPGAEGQDNEGGDHGRCNAFS
jgi:hypothetical protein